LVNATLWALTVWVAVSAGFVVAEAAMTSVGIGLITAREVLQLGFPGFASGWF
jgi:hypothetical protein